MVVEFCWNDMRVFDLQEDLIPVAIGKKWGFVNVKTGETQVKPTYDEVHAFKDGFAPVCIGEKWGIIDVNGNLIAPIKYLDSSYFEGDFAIILEGNSRINNSLATYLIASANWKIINKCGTEIVTGCCWIERTGVNVFTLTREINGKYVKSVKQLIAFPDYIAVIDNSNYMSGYITAKGNYSREFVYDKDAKKWADEYTHTKYLGGGIWSAIDYTGKPIRGKRLQEIKKNY